METYDNNKQAACPSNCPHCGGSADKCAKDSDVTGLELGFWSVVVFLIPLFSAFLGALIGGKKFGTQTAQFVGALVGFGAAAIAAVLLVWLIKRKRS